MRPTSDPVPPRRDTPRRPRHRCFERHRRGGRPPGGGEGRLHGVPVWWTRGREALDRVAADCEQLGAASAMVAPADVSEDAQVESAVSAALARHGALDVVVSWPVSWPTDASPTSPSRCSTGRRHQRARPGQRRPPRAAGAAGAGRGEPGARRVGDRPHRGAGHGGVRRQREWGVRAGCLRQLRVDNWDLPGVRFGYVAPGGVDTPIYRTGGDLRRRRGPSARPGDVSGAHRRPGADRRRPSVAWRPGGDRQRGDPLRLQRRPVGVRPTRRTDVAGSQAQDLVSPVVHQPRQRPVLGAGAQRAAGRARETPSSPWAPTSPSWPAAVCGGEHETGVRAAPTGR